MFRLWGKIFEGNKLIKDVVICIEDNELSRTKKIYSALDDICYKFDLQKPIWLESNIKEFKRISKTRFTKDSFIEYIEFDYLEIHVIEED